MKKLIVIPILLLSAFLAQAQGRHEVNVFMGGFKSEYLKGDNVRNYGDMFFDSEKNIYTDDLADLYEPHYSIKSGPVVTMNYHYIVNSWFRVGAQVNWGVLSGTFRYELSNRPAESFSQHMLSVLPQVKLCIPGARHFRLYGKLAAGAQFNLGKLMTGTRPVDFAWDIVPIGAEWGGGRIYGNAEICYGSVIKGGRIGMGFRF